MKIKVFLLIVAIMLFWSIFDLLALDLQFNAGITLTPSSPRAGDQVTFTIIFSSRGGNVSNLYIRGKIDDTQIFRRIVSFLPADIPKRETFTWIATGGNHQLSFSLDPDQRTGDTNYNNNYVNEFIDVIKVVDLRFTTEISMTPQSPNSGDIVTLTVSYKSVGGPAAGFDVYGGVDNLRFFERKYLLNNPLQANHVISEKFTWTAQAGKHVAWFVLDPVHTGEDIDYSNNRAEKKLLIGGIPASYKPDLYVEVPLIEPSRIQEGMELYIYIHFCNKGAASSKPGKYTLRAGTATIGPKDLPAIKPGDYIEEIWGWWVICGTLIKIEVDSTNTSVELNETNNIWEKKIFCTN